MGVAGRWLAPFLVLCVAGLLLPFLVYFVWDVIVITTHDLWGWELETAPQLLLRLAPLLQEAFPGGSVVSEALSPSSSAPTAMIFSLAAAYVLAAAKAFVPTVGARRLRPDLILLHGLGDVLLSITLGLLVATVMSSIEPLFDNPVGLPVGLAILLGMLTLTVLAAFGRFVGGDMAFAFRILLSLGQVLLAWWAVAGWSLNSYAGSASTLLAIAGCGMLDWIKFLGERRAEVGAPS